MPLTIQTPSQGSEQEQSEDRQLADPAQDQVTVCGEPALELDGLSAGATAGFHHRPPLRFSVSSGLLGEGGRVARVHLAAATGGLVHDQALTAMLVAHTLRQVVFVWQIRGDQGLAGLGLLFPAETVMPAQHALGQRNREHLDRRLFEDAGLLALAAAGAGVANAPPG